MPMSIECLTKKERKRLAVADALVLEAEERRALLCVECGHRVIPHAVSSDGLQAAHFEHFRRNPNCSRSDKRLR